MRRSAAGRPQSRLGGQHREVATMRHRLAGSDQPLAAEVLAADAGIDSAVAPNLHAGRNLRPLAHQRQARVEALRLAPVRPQVVAGADGGTLPDLAVLVDD